MGWPKGKPRGKGNGRRIETEVNLEELLDGQASATPVADNSQQEDEEESNIIVVDTEGRYGVRTYKYGYELHVRRKYNKDTLVENFSPKTKESKQVLFKAGDFGPWQFAPKPFHGRLEALFTTLHQLMVKDKITEAASFVNIAKIILESEQRIVRCLSVN
jgi:hypothetical protein